MSKTSKRLISAIAFLAIPFFLTTSGAEAALSNGACKNHIQHMTPNGPILIWVDDDAAFGHQQHGDLVKIRICKDDRK